MSSAVSRILLVAERTGRAPGRTMSRPTPVLRRYRLARLQLEPRVAGAPSGLADGGRFAHLRRSYD